MRCVLHHYFYVRNLSSQRKNLPLFVGHEDQFNFLRSIVYLRFLRFFTAVLQEETFKGEKYFYALIKNIPGIFSKSDDDDEDENKRRIIFFIAHGWTRHVKAIFNVLHVFLIMKLKFA